LLKRVSLSIILIYSLLPAESLITLSNEIIKTNPEIQEKVHNYKTIVEDYKSAKGDYLPKIDFEATIGKEMTKSASTKYKNINLTKAESSITLTENLFKGFETKYNINEQKVKMLSSAFLVVEKSSAIILDTAKVYLNILKFKELVDLAKENVDIHKNILEQIKQKVDVGFSPKSDMFQIQTRYTLAQTDLITQKQNLTEALTKLHKLLGRFVDKDKLNLPTEEFDIPQSLDEATLKALNNSPSIKIANLNVDIKKYAYKKIKKANYPTLDFILKAEKNKNTGAIAGDTDRYYGGFKLKYNLFNGLKDAKRVQNFISQIHKENEARNKIRRRVIEGVRVAWTQLQSYMQKDKILKEHVNFADLARKAYRDEFMIGKRSLLDLLNIESEYITAKQTKVNNFFSLIFAKYDVMQKMGLLSSAIGAKIDNIDLEVKQNPEESNYKKDKLPLNLETDKDGIIDMQDICDKTIDKNITNYGCKKITPKIEKIIPKENILQLKSSNEQVIQKDDAELIEIENTEPIVTQNEQIELPKKDDSEFIPNDKDEPKDEIVDELQEEIKQEIKPQKKTIRQRIDELVGKHIYFKYKSSEIDDNSVKILEEVSDILKTIPVLKLHLFAYTDSVGSASYNKRLSKKRAMIVKDYLINKGVNPDVISVTGMGEAYPIASNKTPEGRAKNRRVEFKFIEKVQPKKVVKSQYEQEVQQDTIEDEEVILDDEELLDDSME